MLPSVDLDAVQAIRLPFMDLEAQIVRAAMAEPNVLTEEQVGWLRYMVSLARSIWIRTEDDVDIYVERILSRFRWFVKHELEPVLSRRYPMQGLRYVLPNLIQRDPACTRSLARTNSVGCSFPARGDLQSSTRTGVGRRWRIGIWICRCDENAALCWIPVEMIAGTSIGSLVAMFRAKTRVFDQLSMLESLFAV